MKAAFHYEVRVKTIHFNEEKEIKFTEYEKKFEDENPIIARQKAFSHYQSFLDVLLKKNDISDYEARERSNFFTDPGTKTKLKLGNEEVEFSDSFGNGVGVYMVIDNPTPDSDDKINDDFFIHGIKGIGLLSHETLDTSSLMFALTTEYHYYEYYNYNTANKEIEVIFCDRDEWDEPDNEEPSTNKILETPFDWSEYAEPYWWGEPGDEDETETQQAPLTVEGIIKEGENNQVEFKPALLYNFSTGKGGISIKGNIAKAICAFVNSNGGALFIGINDDGNIQGLDYDFSLLTGKNPKDLFRQEYDQMLAHFFGISIKSNVEAYFFSIDGKEIFVVVVRPNKRRAIFLKGQDGNKEFYVRGEASSRQITDVEEILNYCIDRITS